ncbi:hypothetical protein [Pseudokineococcus basanitobsidens]|uniref:hypothetical protein n=1 Tax=Pseudokineococcus basanitobsidens TaxID=1926649 RepID=UPI0030DD28A0
MSRVVPAASGTVACVLLAAAALGSPLLLAPVVALLGLLLAWGWPRLLAVPSPTGAGVVVALAALAAVAVVVAVHVTSDVGPALAAAPDAAGAGVLVVLGLSVVAAFVHQVLRTDGRPRLAESVASTVAGAALAALASGWVSAAVVRPGAVLVGATAAAAALVVSALPWPQRLTGAVGLVAAAAAGALVAGGLEDLSALVGAVAGLVVAGVVAVVDRLLVALPRAASRRRAAVVGVAAVSLAAVPVQLLALVVGP